MSSSLVRSKTIIVSYNVSNILSTHIPFDPRQSSLEVIVWTGFPESWKTFPSRLRRHGSGDTGPKAITQCDLITLKWMPEYLVGETSTLVQVVTRCLQKTRHWRNIHNLSVNLSVLDQSTIIYFVIVNYVVKNYLHNIHGIIKIWFALWSWVPFSKCLFASIYVGLCLKLIDWVKITLNMYFVTPFL